MIQSRQVRGFINVTSSYTNSSELLKVFQNCGISILSLMLVEDYFTHLKYYKGNLTNRLETYRKF